MHVYDGNGDYETPLFPSTTIHIENVELDGTCARVVDIYDECLYSYVSPYEIQNASIVSF